MLDNQTQSVEVLRWSISIAIPALAGLTGVVLGAFLTRKRERLQRRHDFVARQLRDFYSPLLGIRSEIRMLSELRVKIYSATNGAWKDLCADARERGGAEALHDLSTHRFPEFRKVLEYNDRQFAEELLPAYRRMIMIFRDNMWLAEEETRSHFGNLLEFVELWNRWLAESIPAEAINTLGHDEEKVKPFYKHLQEKHDELRAKLSRGDV